MKSRKQLWMKRLGLLHPRSNDSSLNFKQKIRMSIRPLLLYILQKYIFIAVGSIITLSLLYGIDRIIDKIGIVFPASVCLMLIVFFFLSFVSWVKDEEFTEKYILKYIEVPFGFNLRWMNLYFTPPFVTLVLADKVSVKEAFIIAAVFIVGYIVGFAFVGYFVWLLQILLGTYNHDQEESEDVENKSTNNKESINSEKECTNIEGHSTNSNHIEEDYDSDIVPYHTIVDEDREVGNSLQRTGSRFDDGLALSRMTTRASNISEVVVKETKLDPLFVSKLTSGFDFFIYTVMFIVGIPIYFCTGYELPLQLSVAILLFKLCLLPAPQIKKYLHPILISFSTSLLVFYIFSLMKGQNFKEMIRHYETGRSYLRLFDSNTYARWPGAGDFLISMMDISIAALSLAMYRYRSDLARYFFSLMPVIIVFSFMSFFIYPPVCYHLGISPSRSLGFTGRSVTMALGTPLVQALGGSVQLMAVTTIISGILGVFLGDWISFTLLRIRKTDFVSRGVTLGVNCGAVSTAHLLSVDPRAAAMSSLSFTLFGTLMVIMAAIRPLVKIVRRLVGW